MTERKFEFKNIQFIKQAIGMNRQHNNYSLQYNRHTIWF